VSGLVDPELLLEVDAVASGERGSLLQVGTVYLEVGE
jgi:hypothetical protein